MDGIIFDPMGLGYASPFAQGSSTSASASSSNPNIGTSQVHSGHGNTENTMHIHHEANPQEMGGMMPGRYSHDTSGLNADMQALIDSDTIAMWSNAPTGFECVISYLPLVRPFSF